MALARSLRLLGATNLLWGAGAVRTIAAYLGGRVWGQSISRPSICGGMASALPLFVSTSRDQSRSGPARQLRRRRHQGLPTALPYSADRPRSYAQGVTRKSADRRDCSDARTTFTARQPVLIVNPDTPTSLYRSCIQRAFPVKADQAGERHPDRRAARRNCRIRRPAMACAATGPGVRRRGVVPRDTR